MLGQHSPQGELFRPDNLYLDFVGRDSFYGFLARSGHRMFRDRDYAEFYEEEQGRPSVPPSQLCIALLLQSRDGVSDDEAIKRTAFDLRWKVALGLDVDEKLCAKSTLQLFRSKLVLHDKFEKLFQASVDACLKAGLIKRKKLEVAIDTTPVLGRGAVKDTFNLISDQIRTVVKETVALKGFDREELIAEHGLSRHFGKSFKGEVSIDWDDAEQKRALVGQLVADARVALELAKTSLRGYAKDAETVRELTKARNLLAELLLQDVEEEPQDRKGPKIRQGTKRDRIVSTTDPEMRHGRKSSSKTFNGYKASVAVETESGVILATDVIAGNAHDSEGAGELVKQAGKKAKRQVERVLGDTAYGSTVARADITKAAKDVEVVAKVPPATHRKGAEFTVEDFKIDTDKGVARCPAGKRSIRYGRAKGTKAHRFTFSQRDCNDCPLRSKCTTAKRVARKITVSENYDELRRLRKHQRTKTFKQAYRRRVKVEHRIARLVQLGVRQARCFGRAKVMCQLSIAAAVANLVLVVSAADRSLLRGLHALKIAIAVVWRLLDREFGDILDSRHKSVRAAGIVGVAGVGFLRLSSATSRPDF